MFLRTYLLNNSSEYVGYDGNDDNNDSVDSVCNCIPTNHTDNRCSIVYIRYIMCPYRHDHTNYSDYIASFSVVVDRPSVATVLVVVDRTRMTPGGREEK